MRQWSQMLVAAQTDSLVPHGPVVASPRLVEPKTVNTVARAPAAAAKGSKVLPAVAVTVIGALLGLSLLRRSVRDALGQLLAGPRYGEECIVTADLDRADLARAKFDFDAVGHYARPDVFRLEVDEQPKKSVWFR